MIIRSITLGINHEGTDILALQDEIEKFFVEANSMFCEQGMEVRTQRIGLSPFSIKSEEDSEIALSTVNLTSQLCNNLDIRWFAVPFLTIGQNLTKINTVALDIMKQYKNTFINFMASENNHIDRQGIIHSAQFIRDVSQLSDNGFDNFRCGVSFNTKPNGAFFPFMHHDGENGFSIALELILPIVDVIKNSQNKDLEGLRIEIMGGLIQILSKVDDICRNIEKSTGMKYFGIDASLAPHPERPDCSIGYLVELLGVKCFGNSGTIFMASFLTDIIKSVVKRSGIRATGFNGVMYSVLEDHGLGKVGSEPDGLPISQLLALSAICGCGIDMVPVPGDISQNEIASIMLDVAAKATWLGKPLGVRLLPIPGKDVGDMTNFKHDFFINTRVQGTNKNQGMDVIFDSKKSFIYSRDERSDSKN
jgi:uncharacterized protein